MTETADAPRKPPRWRIWAQVLLGIALLAFVVSQVGWHDALTLADGKTVVEGTIDGDVPRADQPDAAVQFILEDGTPRPFPFAGLAQDEIDGERFPRIREGIFRIVRKSDKGLLLLGLAMFAAISQIGVVRWLLLLRAQGVRLTFWAAHKLTYIGFFFNNVVPGPTGGDVVKAVYIARHSPDRRAPAIVTVVVDRILGLVALALIALFSLLTQHDNPKYRELSVFVFGFLACVVVGGVVFFSRRIRGALGIDALIARLPAADAAHPASGRSAPVRVAARVADVVRKADHAMFAWRDHKGALAVGLLMSFANQLAIQVMMWTVAAGLHVTTRTGAEVGAVDYMIVLPVAFIASSLPVLPGGWGLREGVFALCFHFIGVDRNPAVALSVMNGMIQLFWSLVGGVYFLLGRAAGEFRPAPGSEPAAA